MGSPHSATACSVALRAPAPQTRTRCPRRSQARTRSMPPTASSTMESATPTASVRIQMNSGRRRSSETGASQPTPSDPIAMNIDPANPERSGESALSTSAVAGSGDLPAATFPAAGTRAVISGSSNLLWGVFHPVIAGQTGAGGAAAMKKRHRHVSEILASDSSVAAER
ncbi:hypothetical protein D9M72_345610 [compost metagenome]